MVGEKPCQTSGMFGSQSVVMIRHEESGFAELLGSDHTVRVLFKTPVEFQQNGVLQDTPHIKKTWAGARYRIPHSRCLPFPFQKI